MCGRDEKGIVHRDLKPENVFVTGDDRVKVLDFGLAKLLQPNGSEAGSVVGTQATARAPGVMVGTLGYMSPEQMRGQAVDHRSDLFSVGVILYEMLSGERPFQGDSPADALGAILRAEPAPLSVTAAGRVSPALDRIVRHCLEKDVGRRVQSAHDLAFDLEALSGEAPADRAPARVAVRAWRWMVAAGVLGSTLGGLATWLASRTRTVVATPLLQHVVRMTHDAGFSEWPSWSPDGRMFAFSSNRDGNFEVYVHEWMAARRPSPSPVTRETTCSRRSRRTAPRWRSSRRARREGR